MNLSDKEFVKRYDENIESYPHISLGHINLFNSETEFFNHCLIFVFLSIASGVISIAKFVQGQEYLFFLVVFVLSILSIAVPVHKWNKKKSSFLKEIEMTEKEAKIRYYGIVYCRLKHNYYPLIHKICDLNKDARESQERIIKEWYGVDDNNEKEIIRSIFASSYDSFVTPYMPRSEAFTFMNKMFKLAIADDGITKEEQTLLALMVLGSNLTQKDVEFLWKSYSSLFRDDEKESGSGETHSENSATRKSNPHLKPYYEILGLDDTTSDAEIKKAYRALALQYHPDLPKNANRIKECEEMMVKINEAYEKIKG